ncbi:thiol reductant ABC exporter subunit CydC [Oryzobacter telluris]|uniref:thiol reductant ABC exporter subunit CydC n=1 Tax=Oryzobacter telluris TaxID=3149179 RepID=UPI00370D7942
MTTHATSLLRPSRDVVLGGLLGGAATSAGIALTATSGWLVVRASERPVILTLLTAIVGVRAFGIGRPLLRWLERVVSHDAALDDLARRRTAVYAALVPLTPARLGRGSRSAVLTGVVDDLTDVTEATVRVTVPLVSSVVAGLVATLLVSWFAPTVGLVVAALLVAVAAACWMAWRVESRSRDELLAARAEVVRVSDLVARHASDLRAIGGEATAVRWLHDAHATWRTVSRRQSRGRALVSLVLLLATGSATLAAALLADPAVVGAPVAALLVVVPVAVGDALAPLVDTMRSLARAQGSAARLDALLGQAPAVIDPTPDDAPSAPPSSPRPLPSALEYGNTPSDEPGRRRVAGLKSGAAGARVELEGVTASWTGAADQLAPTDLTLEPGTRVAVVGPNGSGKSTLLALLARHLAPTGGRHLLDGTDVADLTLDDVRRHVALVDDEPHVFAATLAANLRLARPDATDDDLHHALRLADLDRWAADLPHGLDTRLGTGGRGLSGGERTRLGVARAVLADRAVVLLDEPIAHLDHPTATAVLDDVLDATAGRSLVMVSHRSESVARFHHVLDLGVASSPTPKE